MFYLWEYCSVNHHVASTIQDSANWFVAEDGCLNIYAWLSLSASAICLSLGIIVYSLNKKGLLNKLFFLASIVSFFYSFTDVMMWQASTYQSAYFWNKMGSMWPFFVVLVLHFALAFTGNKLLKNKLTYAALYLPAVIFWLIDMSTDLINGPPVMKYWGYNDVASQTWVYAISTAWSSILPILAFALCFRYYRNTKEEVPRQQRKFVAIGFAVPIGAFIVTNMLLRAVAFDIPNLGIVSTMFFAGFVGYAISRYDLFAFDAAMAAENIFATMPDSLILADTKGRMFRVNEHFANFLGYKQEELVGQSLSELCGFDRQSTNVLKELTENKVLSNYELSLRTKSGEEKNVLFSGSIVRSKTGRNVGITCIIHDITHRKRMEERLVKAERLASIGELAGQVGHDLRNPLAAIKSAAYILGGEIIDLTQTRTQLALGVINDAVEDSNRIINGLVDYSTDLHLEISSCKLNSLISRALASVQVPKNIEVGNLVSDDTSIAADAVKIERVFADIIRNAVQAMPKGGKLEIQSMQENAQMEISFSDTGEGIPEKVLSKMFSPLNTTKAKGMGLSLPICKRIIEAHNGQIIISSSIGRGTNVKIVLPSKHTLDFEVGKDFVGFDKIYERVNTGT